MSRLPDELICGDDIENIPDPEPLIEGVLDLDSTAVLYGASGAGKSFVALDWALCVATGTPWMGHPVVAGRVLYVIGEGLAGTRARYQAWKKHHGIDTPITTLSFAPRAPNILNKDQREELYDCVYVTDPTYTILDTVARHISGGDENSFETMSQMVEVLDNIKNHTHGCAMAVHHTGKNEDAGSRGHSSLKGAMDTEVHCAKGPTLFVTKQKNHEDGHLLGAFALTPCGDSMVLAPKSRASNANDDIAIRALSSLGGEASYTDWRTAALDHGMKAGSFDRTMKRLHEAMVVRDGTDGDGYHRLAEP